MAWSSWRELDESKVCSGGRINVRTGGAAEEAGVKNDTEVPAEKLLICTGKQTQVSVN